MLEWEIYGTDGVSGSGFGEDGEAVEVGEERDINTSIKDKCCSCFEKRE